MKCSSNCRFLCLLNPKGKCFCTRTGWDIKDLPEKTLNDCPKFIDRSYIRHDILSGKY